MDNQTTDTDTNDDYKLVALVNKRMELGMGKLMNALAHCVAGAVNLLGEEGRTALKFLDFEDASGQIYHSISARSFIILRGSGGDIRKARRLALESGIKAVCFIETMTQASYVEQL